MQCRKTSTNALTVGVVYCLTPVRIRCKLFSDSSDWLHRNVPLANKRSQSPFALNKSECSGCIFFSLLNCQNENVMIEHQSGGRIDRQQMFENWIKKTATSKRSNTLEQVYVRSVDVLHIRPGVVRCYFEIGCLESSCNSKRTNDEEEHKMKR